MFSYFFFLILQIAIADQDGLPSPARQWFIIFKNRANNGSIFDIRYRLNDNPVTNRWVKLVLNHLKTNNRVANSAWAVYPKGPEALNYCYDELYNSIKFVREKLSFFNPYLPPLKELQPIHLNAIHAAFEEAISKTFSVPTGGHNTIKLENIRDRFDEKTAAELELSLNAVNGLVHGLEHLIRREPGSAQSWFSTFLTADISDESKMRFRLHEKDYSLFSLETKFGDLLLGYGTTGKSLWHLYKDKDLALLDAGGKPSPQEYITTNVLAAFYKVEHEPELQATHNWLKENKVGEKLGIDIYDAKNAYGYIKIGEFARPSEWENFSEDQIVALLSPYRHIESYILEMGRY